MFGARPNSQFDAFTQFHVPEAAFDQLFVVNAARAIGTNPIPNRMAMSVERNLDFMGMGSRMLAYSCFATASDTGEKKTGSHATRFSAANRPKCRPDVQ